MDILIEIYINFGKIVIIVVKFLWVMDLFFVIYYIIYKKYYY